MEKVKINEISEKYNKQYLEYKMKELEESAQQMADHLGVILDSGIDIFNRVTDGYNDISSAIEKYGKNYFEGAGTEGIDYNTKKIADYMKALTTAGATDESIGYIKNFRDVKQAIDGYWASFAKSIKMMTDKVSAYFDHQASLIEGNKFITSGQKESMKTRVSQQKAQTLVSAGEATISQYQKAAGKLRAEILFKEMDRDKLKSKIDDKSATAVEIAQYNALNSVIDEYNKRITDIHNNLIPTIQSEVELNRQLAYMPTLLEEVGITAKQSLEDGLLTFLTDGVNECQSLGEAFSNMIVSMLKDLQKMFAKKLIGDLFEGWFGTGDRSQKQIVTPTPFMQQQNPYTDYKNYQLTPTAFDMGLSKKGRYALQPPKFSKLGTGDEAADIGAPFIDTSGIDMATQTISNDLITTGQTAQQTAQQMSQAVSQSTNSLSTQITTSATSISTATNNMTVAFDQFSNKLNSFELNSSGDGSGIAGALGGLFGGSGDGDDEDVADDVADTSEAVAELPAQGEESNQQVGRIKADTQEITANTKESSSDSSHMSESGTPVSESSGIMMPGQSPMGITGNLTGQFGIGAGIGDTVSQIASPITGIVKTVTGEIADFLNAGVFKDLLNSMNSVLGSAGAQLAGVGFAVKSFIKGDTKEKLLSLIFIELQLIYQNVVSLLSYVSSMVTSLDTIVMNTGVGNNYATGGIVTGAGTGTSDSIPAMLSNGEAVITAQRVKQLGAGAIHAINRGDFSTLKARVPKYATGGIAGEGAQNTARGMASFAGNIGANVSTTNNISIGLLRDDDAIIGNFLKSSKGQKHLLDFNRNRANLIGRFNN